MSLLATEKKEIGDGVMFDLRSGDGVASNARRFFHSSAVWDPALRTVVVPDRTIGGLRVADAMEHGGAMEVDVLENGHNIDSDVTISVET